ncbi:hypothetical protein B5X24_HaOG202711 [Helicoverpa armigera]|uniref:Tudor domain-containing protein n=1 Tax=Helicoverpa armigera TaxID=29058 RepID=A0A2W1BSB7_HELAM|nr:hypothetical protein B5X24_HaOG202711 [Helicoverpa armigera]
MVEVMVGEVYSPSHFWLIRLGDQYHIAMENMMDEMTEYYNGPGGARTLARGAVRVGHYCSALFLRDWHRALIVRVLDSDTVKVRYVDYGTTAECYLNPRFEALESGATPNLEEIHAYLRDGIVLDYVAAYREHVPACLPPEPAPAPSDSPASDHPPDLPARIPLWLPSTPDACLPSPSSPTELSSPQVTSQRPLSPPAAPLALSPKDSEPCEAKAHSAINVQLDIHKQPNVNIPPDDNPQTECRRQSVVHPQPAAPCPPPGVVAPAWPGPYPPPGVVAPAWSAPYAPPGAVALSPAECDTYRRLVHVNPEAAHWYMAGALGRAMGPAMGPALGGPPHFPSPPPFGSVRAPPGFNI